MKCPHCNHELEIKWIEPTGAIKHPDGSETIEVVGTCWYCELYDGTWKIDISSSGERTEYNLQRFFFG